MGVLSVMCTLPFVVSGLCVALSPVGACGLCPPARCALSPRYFGFGLNTSHTSTGVPDGWVARWEETGAIASGEFPKVPLRVFFLFEKILLLNPATLYKEGHVLSHSPPLQLDWGLSGSGTNAAELSTLPSRCPQSPWFYHFILIPLPVTSSNQVSLGAAQALFGRGGSI